LKQQEVDLQAALDSERKKGLDLVQKKNEEVDGLKKRLMQLKNENVAAPEAESELKVRNK
jgi:hypothetical protein